MIRRLRWVLLALLVGALAFSSGPAYADTTVGTLNLAPGLNSTATLTFSGGTFSLDFNITNSNASSATINAFSLQLFSASLNVTSDTLPAGWEFFDNQKINNNGTTGCTGKNHPGWLCADDNLSLIPAPAIIPKATGGVNGSIDFLFSGTYTGTPVNPLDLMANGLDASGGKWAVSAGMTTSGPPPPPPPASEPGAMAMTLMGLASVGLACYLRRLLA